jgi:hypothetical protein
MVPDACRAIACPTDSSPASTATSANTVNPATWTPTAGSMRVRYSSVVCRKRASPPNMPRARDVTAVSADSSARISTTSRFPIRLP